MEGKKEELIERSKDSFKKMFPGDRHSVNVFSDLMKENINLIESEGGLASAEEIVQMLEETKKYVANLSDLTVDREDTLENLKIKKKFFSGFPSRRFGGTEEEDRILSSIMAYLNVALGDILELHEQRGDI